MIKALFSLLLIGLLSLSILGLTLMNSLNGEKITHKAREENLYGRLADNLPNLISTQFEFDSGFTRKELSAIITSAVDANTFYDFLAKSSKVYLDFYTGKSDDLAFSYDLTKIKQKMADQATIKVLGRYDNLPVCSSEQLRGWTTNSGFPSCKISEQTTEDIERTIKSDFQRNNFFNTLPDQIFASHSEQSLKSQRLLVQNYIRALYFNYFLTIALIALFFLIYRRRALFSLSAVFIIVGVIFVSASFVIWDLIKNFISQYLESSDLNATFLPLLIDLVDGLTEHIRTNLGNISILTIVSGAVMLILGLALKEKKRLKIGPVSSTQPPL